jgi:hypothetical protein
MLQLRHLGGALAREAPGAGARATLPGEVCLLALGVVMDEAGDAAVRAALADVDAAVRPYRVGDYASRFFEPAVWTRLREVKAQYDPDDLFAGNHHISPAAPAEPA